MEKKTFILNEIQIYVRRLSREKSVRIAFQVAFFLAFETQTIQNAIVFSFIAHVNVRWTFFLFIYHLCSEPLS